MPVTTIPTLPPAPSDRTDPLVYNTTANNWAAALPAWTDSLNDLGPEVEAIGNGATASASTATTQAGIATTKAAEAAVSAEQSAASASATATLWVSGTNYTAGTLQYSPINGNTYRRWITGATTIDPSLDYTNYRTITRRDGVGTIQLLSPTNTANSLTAPNGAKFLKTGVMVTRDAALAAYYDVPTLETLGYSSVMSYSGVTGIAAAGVVFGAGKYVAVGTGGSIRHSTNGDTWTAATSGTAVDLTLVYYLNSLFITLGANVILTSPDGVTWTTKTAPSASAPKWLDFIGGRYVWSSAAEFSRSSTDLTTWITPVINLSQYTAGASNKVIATGGSSPNRVVLIDLATGDSSVVLSNSTTVFSVGYANGKYIALHASGAAYGATSSDGINWTANASQPTAASARQYAASTIAYGNSVYVCSTGVLNTIMSSTDASTWTNRTSNISYTGAVVFVNGIFFTFQSGSFGGGSAGVSTSTDGINWTLRTMSHGITNVTYAAGLYIAVGGNSSSLCYIDSSTDGFTWTNRVNVTLGASTGLSDVIYANSIFVAIGSSGAIYSSTNGTTWTSRTSALGTADLLKIEYLNGYFIVCASAGIMYSTNGTTWTAQTMVSQNVSSYTWNFSAYVNSRWVSLAKNSQNAFGISTAIGTTTFTNSQGPTYSSDKVANSGSRLVVSCSGATTHDSIQTSIDGQVWSGVIKPTAFGASDIAINMTYAAGNFVMLKDTRIWYSTTGLNWSASPVTTNAGTGLAVSYGGSTWFVTGGTTNATSSDLITWTSRSRGPSNYAPTSLTYGAGNFVGTVSSNTIVTPDGINGGIGAGAAVTLANTSTYLQVS
jgi:hypothetical protein